ncbi:Trans-aconitate methyltransferase [Nocardia otitidiscaviarum]|uniref:Trans-aconitate methyltransferase n=1 Tax=Nocardia otitidiscaviarum TaxID=1823 RepID=A0A378YU69_9NOCA|nr:class I SAM-dependent methyltransferase [Nocardia otitidiscaviarum]SUA80303.1 Trans-aconitate methyltransferase [Nocardia otitidiscaviarum]
MSAIEGLYTHFAHPRRPIGSLAGMIMAHRGHNIRRGRWAIDRLAPTAGARVLELGYGPGVTLGEVCRRTPDIEVTGVDISPVMLRQAARRNRALLRSGRLDLRLGDATRLDPELRGFDLVYGINVWQYWSDPDVVIQDLVGRLRPGGRLALVYMRPPGCRLTHGQAATRLADQFNAALLTHITTEWMPQRPTAVLVSGVSDH